MYTKVELEIVDYIENKNPISVKDRDLKIELIKNAVKQKYKKRETINLKVLQSDLDRFKAKALSEGMSYQTLINSVLHKYITGQFVERQALQ